LGGGSLLNHELQLWATLAVLLLANLVKQLEVSFAEDYRLLYLWVVRHSDSFLV
jgi:hypothetical protein